jgi:hypothetical protein
MVGNFLVRLRFPPNLPGRPVQRLHLLGVRVAPFVPSLSSADLNGGDAGDRACERPHQPRTTHRTRRHCARRARLRRDARSVPRRAWRWRSRCAAARRSRLRRVDSATISFIEEKTVGEKRQPVPFAAELSAMPALWTRLLAEHLPDPTGRRCQACTTAGTGSPGTAWPCRIRDAAEAAQARYLRAARAHHLPAGTTEPPPVRPPAPIKPTIPETTIRRREACTAAEPTGTPTDPTERITKVRVPPWIPPIRRPR